MTANGLTAASEVKLYEDVIAIREAALGPDHPDVGAACHTLGMLYLGEDRYDDAELLLQRALEITERAAGPSSLETAAVIEDLAAIDEELGRDAGAELLLRRALAIRSAAGRLSHPDLLAVGNRLGVLYAKQHKFSAAEPVLREVIAAALHHPTRSAELVTARSTLSLVLGAQDQTAEARAELRRARAVADRMAQRDDSRPLAVLLSRPLQLREFAVEAFPADPVGRTSEPPAPLIEPQAAAAESWAETRARWSATARVVLAALRVGVLVALAVVRFLVTHGAAGARRSIAALSRWSYALRQIIEGEWRRRTVVSQPSAVPSTFGDLIRVPADMSAERTIDARQQRVLLGIAVGLVAGVAVSPILVAVAFIALATVCYLAAVCYRVYLFWRSLEVPGVVTVSDDLARRLPDDSLPIYTVLVAAYREPEVIGRLIASLRAIEYPVDRLDIKLLLEEDDGATIAAALAARPPSHIEIVRVPYSLPRTKPKALNHGLGLAHGEFVTIYDAEDRPEPLQLRRAVLAFRSLRTVACLQAKLSYHNADQNLITKWFTVEYAMWFSQLLPGLVDRQAPLPLGGTSNHFRRSILEDVGAWDPYNVTEDADLGIRLHRAGHRTRVLDSVTLEEANSDFINWIKQRSRWYKGYLQTWLIHMRQPRALLRDLGPRGFLGFHLFIGGTPLLAILNPIFWVLLGLWLMGQRTWVAELFPTPVYYLAAFSFVFGNFAILYTNIISARALSPNLVFAVLLLPLYWAMMSLAAIKACLQLVAAPSFWEKTTHGLDQVSASQDIVSSAREAMPT
jgi:glycosyltransferase XagB